MRGYDHKIAVLAAALMVNALGAFAQEARPRMVFVAGGTYWRGSAEGAFAANERAHEVTLSSFHLAETETTQEQWTAVMGSNPSRFPGKDRPVEYVSWMDAVRFANALSEREGLEKAYEIAGNEVIWNRSAAGYRLPTEAEWEYAARGGPRGAPTDEPLRRAPYAGGTNAAALGWYDANSNRTTQPVGRKEPNELGLYDMSGNVWDWCWDWYSDYPRTSVADPAGPDRGTGQRVLRGGAWFTPVHLLRTTYRYWNAPTFKVNSVGFRLARNAAAGPAAAPQPARNEEGLHLNLPAGLDLDPYEILSAPEYPYRR